MKYMPEEIETKDLCHYGCGNLAKYKNKSGNIMCSMSSNSCPENIKKNSNGLIRAFSNGIKKPMKETYRNLSEETKNKMNWNNGKRYADFSYGGKGQHKNALLLERGHKCECCGLSEWMNKKIPLELEHIDADRNNNTKENLKLLCLNCHAQTPTWKIGNNKGWKVKKYEDNVYIDAIKNSTCISHALKKLDLRYGSAKTIVDIMVKYKINFKEQE